MALWWYLSILPNLQEWFGPNGIFPLSMAMEWRGDSGFAISLLDYVHTASQLWLVYILGLISILMMVFGLLTRVSTIAASGIRIIFHSSSADDVASRGRSFCPC